MKHIAIFALPFSAANRRIMQRLGVAIMEESNFNAQPALTAARRLAVADGTVTLADVLLYDKVLTTGLAAASEQSQNFQMVYSLNGSGTQDYLLGAVQMSDAWWNRLASRIADAPVSGMRYARLQKSNGGYLLTVDHNLPQILGPYEGQAMTPKKLLGLVGLSSYHP